MKRIPREAAPKITPTDGDNDQPQRESRKSATKQLLRVKSIPINDSETSCEEVNYKPQRLTEVLLFIAKICTHNRAPPPPQKREKLEDNHFR